MGSRIELFVISTEATRIMGVAGPRLILFPPTWRSPPLYIPFSCPAPYILQNVLLLDMSSDDKPSMAENVSHTDAESEPTRQCRICFDGEDSVPELGRLIRPCLCKGSMSVCARTMTALVVILTLARAMLISTFTSSAFNSGGPSLLLRRLSTLVTNADIDIISLALGL